MKIKKWVSAISALTIAASAFAGMAVTASADTSTVVYQNNFNSVTDDLVQLNMRGTLINGSATQGNTAGSGVLGVNAVPSENGGDSRVAVGNISDMDTYDAAEYVNVELDFKYDPEAGDSRTSTLGLFGATRTSGSTWAVDDDKQILNISFRSTRSSAGFDNISINNSENAADNRTYKEILATTGVNDRTGRTDAPTTGWIHLSADIDFVSGNVSYTLSRGDETLVDVSDASFMSSGAYVPTQLDCIALIGHKINSGIYMDNLVINRVEKEEARADVTFTGNATSIVINGQEAVSGVALPEGEYEYTAKADNYVTEYGTLTVSADDVASGSKTVDITLDAISEAPENTNDTGANVSINHDIIADGFTSANTFFESGVEVQHGDTVVLEYDVYVAGGNSFNITLKGENNGTGANTEFIADQNTITVRNQNSGDSSNYTTLCTYPAGQWAHVKMSFTAAAPTVEGPPATDIKTDNVTVTVKAADGTDFTAENVTPRNLAVGYGEGSGRSYSFNGIDISGTANVANAEMYVLGTRTVEPTATYTQIGDYTSETETDNVGSAFTFTVTPGSETIKTVSVKVNGVAADRTATTEISSGSAVFAVAVDAAADSVTSITAVINGEDVQASKTTSIE